jgi:hypothetical protein
LKAPQKAIQTLLQVHQSFVDCTSKPRAFHNFLSNPSFARVLVRKPTKASETNFQREKRYSWHCLEVESDNKTDSHKKTVSSPVDFRAFGNVENSVTSRKIQLGKVLSKCFHSAFF